MKNGLWKICTIVQYQQLLTPALKRQQLGSNKIHGLMCRKIQMRYESFTYQK